MEKYEKELPQIRAFYKACKKEYKEKLNEKQLNDEDKKDLMKYVRDICNRKVKEERNRQRYATNAESRRHTCPYCLSSIDRYNVKVHNETAKHKRNVDKLDKQLELINKLKKDVNDSGFPCEFN